MRLESVERSIKNVREIRSQIFAIFQTQFAFEVFSTKKATLWAYVTKNDQGLYQLRYRLLERKLNGTQSTVGSLSVLATTHLFERLLQQGDTDAVSLAKELFNFLIATNEISKTQSSCSAIETATPISIASLSAPGGTHDCVGAALSTTTGSQHRVAHIESSL